MTHAPESPRTLSVEPTREIAGPAGALLSGGLVRRVVAAACRNSAGRIVVSARHYDPIMRAQIAAAEGLQRWRGCEQGFIDQLGNFLTRQEAHAMASANGQIIRRCGGDTETLYSENLY